MGRPSDYTPELALTICERLVNGESLRAICRDEGMPSVTTIFRWNEANEAFRDQYARARDMQAEMFADELAEISDDGSNDWMARNDPENPGWVVNGEHLQRSKLRVDTRKWIASRILFKKYGDKIEQQHTGPGGGPLVISSTDAEL